MSGVFFNRKISCFFSVTVQYAFFAVRKVISRIVNVINTALSEPLLCARKTVHEAVPIHSVPPPSSWEYRQMKLVEFAQQTVRKRFGRQLACSLCARQTVVDTQTGTYDVWSIHNRCTAVLSSTYAFFFFRKPLG